MADISLPTPGQKPWSLNPAITAMNNELNGRLSQESLQSTIDAAIGPSRDAPMPVFSKHAGNPIWKTSDGPYTEAIWPSVVRVGDKYYKYESTDHDLGLGGIALSIADSPFGPFVSRGQVFQDTTGGEQTETPSVIYAPEVSTSEPFFMYYQKKKIPGLVEQSTFLARSADGITWRVHGVVVTAPNQVDVPGSGEMTYFRPFRIGGRWYAYHLYGAGTFARFGMSTSYDGITWQTDRRQLGFGAEWFQATNGRRLLWNNANVIIWRGRPWWVGLIGGFAAGTTVGDKQIALAPLAPDLRSLEGPPIPILPPTQAWESSNIKGNWLMADGDNLYLYYQCGQQLGVAVAKG